jgi:hypothetical protein
VAEAFPDSAAPFLAAVGQLDAGIQKLLPERDSLQKVLTHLESTTPESLLIEEAFERRRLWQDSGLFYAHSGRFLEAIELFSRLHEKICEARLIKKDWLPCGMPLVWVSDFYRNLNCPQLAFRFPPAPEPEQSESHQPQPQPAPPQTQAQQPASAPPSNPPQRSAVAHPFRGETLRSASPPQPAATPNPSAKATPPQPAEIPASCHSERSEEPAFSSSPAPSPASAHAPQTPTAHTAPSHTAPHPRRSGRSYVNHAASTTAKTNPIPATQLAWSVAPAAQPDNPLRTGPPTPQPAPNRNARALHFDHSCRLLIDGKPF